MLKTSKTPAQMRDDLSAFLDSNDELLVLDVTGDIWATRGIAKSGSDWLQSNL